MASPDHVAMLNHGVESWNKWRKDNPSEKPDLTRLNHPWHAKFLGKNLRGADLSNTRLDGSKLIEVDLQDCNLQHASLRAVTLESCNLANADLS